MRPSLDPFCEGDRDAPLALLDEDDGDEER